MSLGKGRGSRVTTARFQDTHNTADALLILQIYPTMVHKPEAQVFVAAFIALSCACRLAVTQRKSPSSYQAFLQTTIQLPKVPWENNTISSVKNGFNAAICFVEWSISNSYTIASSSTSYVTLNLYASNNGTEDLLAPYNLTIYNPAYVGVFSWNFEVMPFFPVLLRVIIPAVTKKLCNADWSMPNCVLQNI